MDLSQQELPITAYFTRDNKHNKARKRKLAVTLEPGGGPAGKRGKRAVASPNVRPSARGNAKRAGQLKFPALKSPIASTSSRRDSVSDDVVVLDSSPKRPVAGANGFHAPKANSRISMSRSSRDKRLTHVASTAAQSLTTPPPTNQSKRRPIAITAALDPIPQRTTVTSIAPGVTALPTPETTVRKLGNTHAPSGFIGATSPCRANQFEIHALSSPPPASASLMMKFSVAMDGDLDHQSRKYSGFFNGTQQTVDPDDPFTCTSWDKGVHVTTPTSSLLPSKNLRSTPGCSKVTEELVPSSQSQYLLPINATPSRKRPSKQHVRSNDPEPVASSQSQEKEMGMPFTPGNMLNELSSTRSAKHDLFFTALLTSCYRVEAGISKSRPTLHVAHRNGSPCRRLHQFSLGSSPLTSPVDSRSNSFLITKSPRNKPSFIVSPPHSPLKHNPHLLEGKVSPITKSVGCTESRENVHPVQEDDSVTEPESEPEVLKPGPDDGSETEPESEIEPVRLPTEIGKSGLQDMVQWPRAASPRASILHGSTPIRRSPYRKRQTPAVSYTSSLEDLMREGAGMSVPSRRFFLLPSSATPTAARDFLDMFQGDASYPDDFPESLRC